MIPFDVAPPSATIHEGHGGPGPSVQLEARHLPWYLPLISPRGLAMTFPAGSGLGGVPITWSSPQESVLAAHGTLGGTLGAPLATDVSGAVRITYQTKQEEGDQSGQVVSVPAVIFATVSLRDLVTNHYALHPTSYGLLMGDRVVMALLTIGWHASGWYIDHPSAGGRITGQKCGGIGGTWIADGTYETLGATGDQTWVIEMNEIDQDSGTGTFTYADEQVSTPIAGVTVTVSGRANGVATLEIDAAGRAHIHLRETAHTYAATTSVGGSGGDQNAPLAETDLIWEPGGACS